MSEDEIKRILGDMEKQGFPLEVQTSQILEAHGWEVTNQAAYLDYEEKKYRTVDIIAEKNILLTPKLTLDLWLVIECKKSTKPWVFYASDFDLNKPETRRKAVSSTQFFISQLAYQKKLHKKLLNLVNQFMLENHFLSPIFGKLAHIPFEPFTEGQGGSIHKATMQVCNAILDLENRRFQEFELPTPYGIIFMPLIVLDGRLYTYKNEKLNSEDALNYYATYADSAFMLEIVTKGFLNAYLELIEAQIKNFQKKYPSPNIQ